MPLLIRSNSTRLARARLVIAGPTFSSPLLVWMIVLTNTMGEMVQWANKRLSEVGHGNRRPTAISGFPRRADAESFARSNQHHLVAIIYFSV